MIHERLSILGTATLETWFPSNSAEMNPERTRPTVVICPGGGYLFTSDREAEPIALRLAARGINAAVLRYSCAPARFPVALRELAASVALLRERAREWNVAKDRVFTMGFSAGGHLAASLGVLYDDSVLADFGSDIRPNGLVLCYPVILSREFSHEGSFAELLGDRIEPLRDSLSLDLRVTERTPPAFIWHTWEDEIVPLENSLAFARALRRHGVPFEYHVFQRGKHGLSTASKDTINAKAWGIEPSCQVWIDMAARWIDETVASGEQDSIIVPEVS